MTFQRFMAAAVLTICLPVVAVACTTPANVAGVRAEAVRQINAERQRAGLPALAVSDALNRAAQGHACDSAGRRKMGHTGSDGSKFTARIRRAGYVLSDGSANENVGFGYGSAAAMVQGWMASPPHRRNILSRQVSEVGIGVAAEPGNRLHWVFVSASPGR